MNFTQMQHIPLASAYLCPDCNCIGNCAGQCPACASPVLLALANVLDRKAARNSVLPYTYNNYQFEPKRAFLLHGRQNAVRSHMPAPTPITAHAGLRARADAHWRLAKRSVGDEAVGVGMGEAS
jgi:hypothetical protein